MLPLRLSFRGFSRSFSTARPLHNQLSYQVFGPEEDQAAGHPIVFLHGLFGSKQNNRSISKVLARDLKRQVFTVDLRNHGQSFHSNDHSYPAMAADVEEFLQQQKLAKSVLIGHSMGAKTAMVVALRSPAQVAGLIPVDNAPVIAPLKSDFSAYVEAMRRIEAANVTKQSDADQILQEYESSLPIRQFLLTNLVRGENNMLKFRIPLATLGASLDAMADFPYKDPGAVNFDGPTIFVRGTRSGYVKDDFIPAIRQFFPNSQLADVDAGHWLISENPEAFRQVVVKFLQNIS